MPSNRLVALWAWYHGAAFRGYQSQPQGPTVQDTLISALRSCGLERNPVASGRTDLGVHARMQVLSLRVVERVQPTQVAGMLNAVLPPTMGIVLSREAKPKFHAAWLATGKTYRYRLSLADDPRWAGAAWRIDVKPERVAELLHACVGTRDFWAFHDKSSSQKLRTITGISVNETGGLVDIELRGEGFARYMVRFLVGAAISVARGEQSEEVFRLGLESARAFEPQKAPAHGLILWSVDYPDGMHPFTEAQRASTSGLPSAPPFTSTR